MSGRRPTKGDLAAAIHTGLGREDVLPYPTDAQSARKVRVLAVGINPSPWTAAVNAPFARPGNRFWKSLATAEILLYTVDASTGLSPTDERMLADVGFGITNFVSCPSSRADELTTEELQAGGQELIKRVKVIRPNAVAVLGVTAFRTAYSLPKTTLGLQPADVVADWPVSIPLWVLPNPSGLNAHENIASLAAKWRAVCEASHHPPSETFTRLT